MKNSDFMPNHDKLFNGVDLKSGGVQKLLSHTVVAVIWRDSCGP